MAEDGGSMNVLRLNVNNIERFSVSLTIVVEENKTQGWTKLVADCFKILVVCSLSTLRLVEAASKQSKAVPIKGN